MNSRLVYILLLFCTGLNLSAQKPMRIELETKIRNYEYSIMPIDKDGLIVMNFDDRTDRSEVRLSFDYYNSLFQKKWTEKHIIPVNYSYVDYIYRNDFIYVFFSNPFGKTNDFIIIRINVKSQEKEDFITSFSLKGKIKFIELLGDNIFFIGEKTPSGFKSFVNIFPALIGARKMENKPFVLKYNLVDRKQNPILITYPGNITLLDAETNNKDNTLELLSLSQLKGNKEIIYFLALNEKGDTISSKEIHPENKNIITGKLATTGENTILVGTFNDLTKGSKNDTYAQGMFVKNITENSKGIRYYNFTEFKNFYVALSLSMRKKVKRKQEKGKSVSVTYRLLFHHDVLVQDSQVIVVAEAYYPEYHTEWRYDYYGRSYPVEVFDGYRHTHAIVAAFDENENLIWDNTFEINNIISDRLKERVSVLQDGTEMVMVYSFDGDIHFKVIRESEVLESKDVIPIETGVYGDKIVSNFNTNIERWYDNYLLLWGYQKIKNKTKDKREVFFFNKIAFQ